MKTKNTLRILGIDPGYDRLGLAVLDKEPDGKEKLIFSECLITSRDEDIHDRLFQIGSEINKVIAKFKPQIMAVENLFITKNQKTAMRVAESRGIAIYEAMKKGLFIFEYSPMEIKTSITGDGTSDKERMIKMVNLLIKIKDKKRHDDEYDAIAVALTCSARIKSMLILTSEDA